MGHRQALILHVRMRACIVDLLLHWVFSQKLIADRSTNSYKAKHTSTKHIFSKQFHSNVEKL